MFDLADFTTFLVQQPYRFVSLSGDRVTLQRLMSICHMSWNNNAIFIPPLEKVFLTFS